MDVIKQSRCIIQSGFTLIELLVVIVIIGIIVGLTTVQLMPGERGNLKEEAERLALLIENARLDAYASGQNLAWSGHVNKYIFSQKNAYGDWIDIQDDNMLRPRTLPNGMFISKINVESIPLKEKDKLLLSSSSLPLPFEIELSSGDYRIQIEGNSLGEVNIRSN